MEGGEPIFGRQGELVDAHLEIIRARIRYAIEQRTRGATKAPFGPREIDEAERRVAERTRATRSAGLPLPLTWLEERLGLEPSARIVLWILIAHEICPIARGLLRELNTENCADPTTDTLRTVAFGTGVVADAYRLFSSASPLITGRLIERTDTDANSPDHRRTWKVAGRITALAHEDVGLDPELLGIAKILQSSGPLGIGGEGIEATPELLPALTAALAGVRYERQTLVVQGPRGSGRRSLLIAAAAARGVALLEVDLRRLDPNAIVARHQLALVRRECRLFDLIPLLRDLDALEPPEPARDESTHKAGERIALVIDALDGIGLLATTSAVIPGNRLRRPQIVELPPLTGAQRTALWGRALPDIDPSTAALLATMYPVVPSMIDAAASVARAQPGAGIHTQIRTGLRAVLDGRLAGLAHRIDTPRDPATLVLPKEQRELVDELIHRVKQRQIVYETWQLGGHAGRGLGVSALFSGPPGTGKTLAAGLIATELSTDLYQIDMSKIVSKWIGETEKNLASVFEAAESGHAILLFDEADALFGKRTDVKSSNDRHANQETNFLLQRLESFRGVCILTTNHTTAIDDAFQRRIALHVRFPMPDVDERERLWKSMFRASIPSEGALNFRSLASRFEMSGGHIRNAVLRAAFAAARASGAVNHDMLQRAAQLEYQAMGRITPSSL